MRESLAGAEDGVRIGTRGGGGGSGRKGPFSRDAMMVIVGAVSTLVVVGVILAIALPLGLRQRPAPNGDGSLSSGSGSSTSGGGQQFEWDTLVSNGFVVDGTGLAGFYADVAIADGKIVAIGANLSSARAREVIDASGLVVAPGFIDSHVHSDWVFAQDPTGDSKLRDGITSELTGMCGFSLGPCTGECLGWRKALFLARIPDSVLNNITTLDDAYKHYERNPPMTNLAMFVGWNTVRMTACGYAENCSAAQLSTAKTLIDEAMLQGAWGLSHGLEYVPSSFSSREELVETAAVAAARGGFMPVHMRNEKIDVLDSVAEVIDIARRSGIRPQISHFKIAGLHLSYKIDEMLAMFDAAVSEGMDLWADAYPYNAMGTTLALGLGSEINNLPLDQRIAALQNETVLSNLSALADSGQLFLNLGVTGWSDILVVGTGNSSWDGKSVPNISSTLNLSPFETWIHVLLSTNFKCSGVYFAMNETIVQRIMKHPRVMVGSDGSPARPGGIKATHPRRFGTASRAIGHYGRDVGLFPLEYAVYRITGMVARRYSIPLRGQIAVGNWADITIFDRDAIVDKATYENMEQYSEGIVHVLVNGKVAVRNALPTGVYAGKVIRGPAYQP